MRTGISFRRRLLTGVLLAMAVIGSGSALLPSHASATRWHGIEATRWHGLRA